MQVSLRCGDWRFCWGDVIYIIYFQVRKCDGCRRITCRTDKDSQPSTGKGVFCDAELIASVEEQPHIASNGPDSNADFAWRRGCISTWNGLMNGQFGPAADPFRPDLSIACQDKTIERTTHTAYHDPIIIFSPAQAGAGGDLCVEIVHDQLAAHACHIILGLHHQGQAVVADGSTTL